ncbi:pyridoxal phosphate-dependent aminotransferase [Longispora urticae]
MQLFGSEHRPRSFTVPPAAVDAAERLAVLPHGPVDFMSDVDERMLEVYRRATDPDDPFELRDLWLGRVEHELGPHSRRSELAELWRSSRVRRNVEPADVLRSRATARFVKELFNSYFRDDLYGELRPQAQIVLSGGAVDEQEWGLPETLKECIRFALERDWYGYSDSRGRLPAREAIAAYENARIAGDAYGPENVAITMGGTAAISSIADFVLQGGSVPSGPVLCATPNYPPLVEAVARRHDVRLVPVGSEDGRTSLAPLLAALTPDTPMVLLQTVGNPTGAAVSEAELATLIDACGPRTLIVLDECHEWLGPPPRLTASRTAANVVRVSSLSKNWSAPGIKTGWLLADTGFVAEYYEYASTTFGGPPSFFYTLVEVLARMERWMLDGVDRLGLSHLHEFEAGYNIRHDLLQRAYDSYRRERRERESGLLTFRDAACARFVEASAGIVRPHYSINMAVQLSGWDDSYLCFRDLLRETGVSVLPGIITFCFSGSFMRVTSARRWEDLSTAVDRIGSYLAPVGPVELAGLG